MKRFISALLVAILVVTSIATMGFAAETPASSLTVTPSASVVKPGETFTVAVNVAGDAFEGFEFELDLAEGLEYVSFKKGDAYEGGCKIIVPEEEGGLYLVWGGDGDLYEANGLLCTITLKVADNAAAGTYNIKATNAIFTLVIDGAQGEVPFTVSNGAVTIEGPACEHANVTWAQTTAPTCTEEGVETGTCADCGVVVGTRAVAALGHVEGEPVVTAATCTEAGKTEIFCTRCNELIKSEAIAALGHKWSELWQKDEKEHWHLCDVCGALSDKEGHIWPDSGWYWVDGKAPTEEEGAIQACDCSKCGYPTFIEVGPLNPDTPVPPTGDISGVVTTGITALVIVLFSVVAVVIKRKTV